MENYRYIRQIGEGSYGKVWLVRNRKDKKQLVLKQIKIENVSKRELRTANFEVQLLATLRHPNIVSYKDSFETGNGFLYIAMGYCEGGDLYTRIKQQNGVYFEEKQIIQWFIQICMALQYLHERKILHRDLKTKNIFLTKRNIVKVGDLGIAKVLEGETAMATTMIGTPYYMSPELFSNRPYNFKSDIWALGCCIYELTTLKHAFDARDINSLMYKIIKGKVPTMPSHYSVMLLELIVKMLSHDPKERPSVTKILRNQFVRKNIEIFLAGTPFINLEAKNEQLVSTPRKVTNVSRHTELASKPIENVNLSVNGIRLVTERVSKEDLEVESGVFCDPDEGIGKDSAIQSNVELPAINSKPNSCPKNNNQNCKMETSKEDLLCVDGREILLEEKPNERGSSYETSLRCSRDNHERRLLHLRHLKQPRSKIFNSVSNRCNNVDSELLMQRPQIKLNDEMEPEVFSSQFGGNLVLRNLPPLSVKNAALLNNRHQIQSSSDSKCLPSTMNLNGKIAKLPPLPLSITKASDDAWKLTDRHQRPPNNTARQRRRQKQLKELYPTPTSVTTHDGNVRDGQITGDLSQATTTIIDTDSDNKFVNDFQKNSDGLRQPPPDCIARKSSTRKCRRSVSLSSLEDVDVTKLNSLSLLKQHISFLEKDCVRGLGRDLLERVLELLDEDPNELKMVLNTKKDGHFITKLFQLKLCRDSLRNFPQNVIN